MEKGIVRKFDELGRITIPKEMRRSLKLKEKDPVDIYLNNGAICMEPVREASCAICSNSSVGMLKVNNKHICLNCLDLVREEGKKVGRN